MGGAVARRTEVRIAGRIAVRTVGGAGLSAAGSTVRELGAAAHHPAECAAGRAGGPVGAVRPGARQRCVLPDRTRPAGRTRRQERHSDRRVRGAAARARPEHRRSRHRGVPSAAASDSDDVARLHPGCAASGAGDRSRSSGAQLSRHRGGRRHAAVDGAVSHFHSGAVCGHSHTRPRTDR